MLRLLAAKAVLGSACRASSAGRSTFVAAANAAQTKAVPWRAALSCCGSSRRGLQSRAASFATFRRSAVEGGVPCVNASRRVAFFNGNQVTGWGQRVASLSMRRGQIRGNSDKSAHAQRQANSGSAKGSANGANAGGKSGGSGGSGGNESSPKNFAMTTFLKTGAVIVQLVVVTNLVKNYVFDFTHCVGSSMLPTFNRVGDLALTEHLTFYTRDPRRGDVVLVCLNSLKAKCVIVRRQGIVEPLKSRRPSNIFSHAMSFFVWVVIVKVAVGAGQSSFEKDNCCRR